LEDAVHALNYQLLLALKFSLKKLLLGLVINMLKISIEDSTSSIHMSDSLTQMAYIKQQWLDGYNKIVRHTIKRKQHSTRNYCNTHWVRLYPKPVNRFRFITTIYITHSKQNGSSYQSGQSHIEYKKEL
jgi:hypothetical protein